MHSIFGLANSLSRQIANICAKLDTACIILLSTCPLLGLALLVRLRESALLPLQGVKGP